MKHTKNLVCSAVLMLLGVALAVAQSDRGAITGTVTDPANAVVPGAKLVLRNIDTGAVREAQTTPTGNFTLNSLPVGTYNLTVQATGFKTEVASKLGVEIDKTLNLNVRLQVGATTESITVTSAAELLKTDNAEQSMVVSGEKLNELPINFGGQGSGGGIRNWLTFTYLAPGVAGTSATAEVNGLPGSNYKVYLEGQDSTSPVAVGWTSTVQSASVEAVTEFAVQSSNFSAEYGQVLGGLYNFTTKSGTNQYHGSAYEELTNEFFNAAQPWDHVLNKDRQSDYGFSVGGPVRIPKIYNGKNRTFFFFNLEGYTTSATSILTQSVPTAAYRQGDFGCALYAASTNCTGNTVSLTDPTSGYKYLQRTRFSTRPAHLLRIRTGAWSATLRFPKQCNSDEPHGPGGAEDSGIPTGADEQSDYPKLVSHHRHADKTADPEPQTRPEPWRLDTRRREFLWTQKWRP